MKTLPYRFRRGNGKVKVSPTLRNCHSKRRSRRPVSLTYDGVVLTRQAFNTVLAILALRRLAYDGHCARCPIDNGHTDTAQ